MVGRTETNIFVTASGCSGAPSPSGVPFTKYHGSWSEELSLPEERFVQLFA
jgi:hypothetical protein